MGVEAAVRAAATAAGMTTISRSRRWA
jgi:hypothetical protein